MVVFKVLSSSRHEQPEKSISFTFTMVPAIALSGLLLASWLLVTDEGRQSEVPPLRGTLAFVRILNSTSVAGGVEYEEIVPLEKIPTRGLLAGSVKVYSAQFEFEGTPDGQAVLDDTERLSIEASSAGMVTSRVTLLPMEMDCKADTEASMLAAVDPVFAVTNPWKVVGPLLLPVSAVNGIFPKFVPPGTPTATVALYATPASLIATATTSNVAVEGSGQKGHCLLKDDVGPSIVSLFQCH